MANSRNYRTPTVDDDADVPYWNDLLAQDVANDMTSVEAAADAAGTAAADLASRNLSFVLIYEAHAGDTTLSVVRGAPVFTGAGKFGQGMTGAVLRYAGLPAELGDYTVELWIKRSTIPGSNTCLFQTPFGYIGMSNVTGQAFYNDPSNKAGPALTDGAWHHVAMVVAVLPGIARTFKGLWVDGVQVIAPTAQLLTSAWTGDLILGGFLASGADNLTSTYDTARVSHAPNDYYTQAGTTGRYSGTFAPPTAAFEWDPATRFLAPLESLSAYDLELGYPPRPAGGHGTYIGPAEVEPTDMQARDFWIKES